MDQFSHAGYQYRVAILHFSLASSAFHCEVLKLRNSMGISFCVPLSLKEDSTSVVPQLQFLLNVFILVISD